MGDTALLNSVYLKIITTVALLLSKGCALRGARVEYQKLSIRHFSVTIFAFAKLQSTIWNHVKGLSHDQRGSRTFSVLNHSPNSEIESVHLAVDQ
jgi:hypothetical protein